MKLLKKFKTWWAAERVGRFEEGTSQDMCPTNGAAVTMALVMSAPLWISALIALFTYLVFGINLVK